MRKKAGEKKVEASARTRKQEIRAASLFSPSSPCTLDFFFLWRFQCRAPRKLVEQNPNSCLRFLYCLWLQSLFRFLVYVESCKQLSESRAIYNPVPWALVLLLKPGLKHFGNEVGLCSPVHVLFIHSFHLDELWQSSLYLHFKSCTNIMWRTRQKSVFRAPHELISFSC